MAIFRNCRYQVNIYRPAKALWSHHSSLKAAQRSFREAVNNRRGDHSNGAFVELADIAGDATTILGREVVHPWP